MKRATLTALVWVTAYLTAPAQVNAGVVVVDCVSGPNYTIEDGIRAANPYDTISIHPCTYYEAIKIEDWSFSYGKPGLKLVAAGLTPASNGARPVGVGAPTSPPPAWYSVVVDGGSFPFDSCLRITGHDDITVEGLRFSNCQGHAIDIYDANNVVVHGNFIDSSPSIGILVTTGSNAQVTGNTILSDTPGPAGWGGIALESGDRQLVADNHVRGAGLEGIFVSGSNQLILNNYVENSNSWGHLIRAGLRIHSGLMNHVHRNTIVGSIVSDIRVDSSSDRAELAGNDTDLPIDDAGLLTALADNN